MSPAEREVFERMADDAMEEYKRLKREYMSRSENLPIVATTGVQPEHTLVNSLPSEAAGGFQPTSTNMNSDKTEAVVQTTQHPEGDTGTLPRVLPTPTVHVDHMQQLYPPPRDPYTVAFTGGVGEAMGAGILLQQPPRYFQAPAGYEVELGADRVVYLVQNPFDNFVGRQGFHASPVPVERCSYSAVSHSVYRDHSPESLFPVNVATLNTTEHPSSFQTPESTVEQFLASSRRSHYSMDVLDNASLAVAPPMRMNGPSVSEGRSFAKTTSAGGSANRVQQQFDSLSNSIATVTSVKRETAERPPPRKRVRGMSSLPNIPKVIGSSSSLYTGHARPTGSTNLDRTVTHASSGYRKAILQKVFSSINE
eukprot:scaffold4242_cov175-Amphora_coffeaeformis.AAC.3